MKNFKSKFMFCFMVTFALSCGHSNSLKQTEFYVRGNCGMCEERIEKTVSDLDGVVKADWNVETKNLAVSYDSTKISEAKIQEAVANVGHETKTIQSPQAVHDALPECCKKNGKM
ncbi:MAG TPA: heavy-metal-associated domain-containing protein [Cytophagaceae bacterium]|jgi:Cu(I)/Ag(I) efflux system membrane fusion protein|nr:heavy-metal-associated domain-containing protein [Cytophagaceae bacterium]